MKCPNCRMVNINAAIKCVCGYEFIKSGNYENNTVSLNPFSAPNRDSSTSGTVASSSFSASKEFIADGFVSGSYKSKKFNFHGTGSDLFSIYIVNFLLIIVTFGIYYFWGKAKIKRYMYSQSEFDGDRFTFHGTGNELFKGGMIAIGFLVIYSLISEYVNKFITTPAGLIASVLIGILFLFVIAAAVVLSRRYYLSRTTWRGIRFTFRGKIKDFISIFFKGYFLSFITLGLYAPYFINNYQEFIISRSYFGNQNFSYSGNGKDIVKVFLKYFLFMLIIFGGFIVTLTFLSDGSLMKEYIAAVSQILFILVICLILVLYFLPLLYFQYWIAKYKWNHTSFLGAKFQLVFSFFQYLKLKAGNAFILIFTLGFGWPWVAVRNAKFFTKYLNLEGDLDFDVIKQSMIDTSATGESVADIFNIDSGLDIGI
ncbi:MAG: YjgN family protein [Thermodesulfobacteriota bacterium]